MQKTQPIRWAAQLSHVREVGLLGSADWDYWRDRLQEVHLVPAKVIDHAQIMIVAAEARYLGLSFRELSVSVVVDAPQQTPETNRSDAAYLIRAFNSRRFFAFCERTFFSTPYYAADIRLTTSPPVSMHVTEEGRNVLGATMGATPAGQDRVALRRGEESWQGPIFLPKRAGSRAPGKWFQAQLRGFTEVYPFLPEIDSVMIPSSHVGALSHALLDSKFCGYQWVIRRDAFHAKSKTYARS